MTLCGRVFLLVLWASLVLLVPFNSGSAQTASGSAGQAPKETTPPKKSAKSKKVIQSKKPQDTKTKDSKMASPQGGKGNASSLPPAGSSSVKGQKGKAGAKSTAPAAKTPQVVNKKKTRAQKAATPVEDYKAAVVMNARTGEVIFQENSHKKLVPASLTKMMLALVAMERLRSAALRLDDRVTVGELTTGVGGTQIDLQPGEAITIEDLLLAIIIRSANDAAATLAGHVGGSQEGFVAMMNAHAQKLGMKDTLFQNVHGLPEKNGQDNISTAYDMAILAKELLKYPQVLEWSSREFAVIRDGEYIIHSTNKLLGSCEGVDGLKTGFIRKAGFSIAATAKRQGMRIIAVVMGSPSGKVRNTATKNLLTVGFDRSQGRAAHAKRFPFNPA